MRQELLEIIEMNPQLVKFDEDSDTYEFINNEGQTIIIRIDGNHFDIIEWFSASVVVTIFIQIPRKQQIKFQNWLKLMSC